MATNLPIWSRFYLEDYKDYPPAFASFPDFINKLNIYTSGVYNALNGNLTDQNLQQSVVTFTITAGSTNTFSFVSPLNVYPTCFIVGNVIDKDGSPVTSTVSCYGNFDGKNINLTSINGLTSGHTYTISVLVR